MSGVCGRQEKMPIPSVVIEPASSNEGDDDRDATDIISPTALSDNSISSENQELKHMGPSGGLSGLPDDFLFKVRHLPHVYIL